jgi:hypothetical protein
MSQEQQPEHEFLGGHKDKVWTYLILMGVLLVVAVIINFEVRHTDAAITGMHEIAGLPTWVLALIVFAVGAVIYWLGLKVETDWPEALGAFFISGSLVALELVIGWSKFDLGGMFVVPFLIPLVVFLGLLAYAVRNSV